MVGALKQARQDRDLAESPKEGFMLPRARMGALIGAPTVLSAFHAFPGAPAPAIS
jgi:hypothetical protein